MDTDNSLKYRKLISAAMEIARLNPWKWMGDSELFGVKDPVSGKTGYCCVMGTLGTCFGITVYRGAPGLAMYFEQMKAYEFGEPSGEEVDELMKRMDCISLYFDPAERLERKDKELVWASGVKADKRFMPSFKTYDPGYYPWFMEDKDFDFMTVILEQALEVAKSVRADPEMLGLPKMSRIYTRVFEGGAWKGTFLKPEPTVKSPVFVATDSGRISRIKAVSQVKDKTWECELFSLDEPVKNSPAERPVYPLVFLLADKASYFILGAGFCDLKDFAKDVGEVIYSAAEKYRRLPIELIVKEGELFEIVRRYASPLGVNVVPAKNLKTINTIKKDMIAEFKNRKKK